MKAFLVFLLVPGAMALYMVSVFVLGPYERYPLVWFAIVLGGIVGLAALVAGHFTWWRVALLALAVVLGGLFVWWTLGYSEYAEARPASLAAVGEPLGEATSGLVDSSGDPFDLPATLASHETTILVFYRGFW
ncbi:hypothetical protein BH23VER1_BH23VER1_29670 [soil metagenome]